MEFELKITGSPEEIRRVIDRVADISGTYKVDSVTPWTESAPDTLLIEFVSGLKYPAFDVLRALIDGSLDTSGSGGLGVTDADLRDVLEKYKSEEHKRANPWGVVGGLGRRWTAVVGGSESPFRKQSGGENGRYLIKTDLARQLDKAIDAFTK